MYPLSWCKAFFLDVRTQRHARCWRSAWGWSLNKSGLDASSIGNIAIPKPPFCHLHLFLRAKKKQARPSIGVICWQHSCWSLKWCNICVTFVPLTFELKVDIGKLLSQAISVIHWCPGLNSCNSSTPWTRRLLPYKKGWESERFRFRFRLKLENGRDWMIIRMDWIGYACIQLIYAYIVLCCITSNICAWFYNILCGKVKRSWPKL